MIDDCQSFSYQSRRIKGVVLATFLWLLIGTVTFAQIIYNPNDERFKQLALEKAIWNYKQGHDEFLRVSALSEKGFAPPDQALSAERSFRIAEIELKQALLALSQDTPYLIIEEVVRNRKETGETTLRVKLRNAAQIPKASHMDSLMESISGDFVTFELFTIRNIFVSLVDSNTIIGLPYEQKVEELVPGGAISIEYVLLRDVSDVTVVASHSGRTERKRVMIQRGSSGQEIMVSSYPRSQESLFGTTAKYDIKFDQVSGHRTGYSLEVEGLSDPFTFRFFDPRTASYVRKLIFPPATAAQQLRLEVLLPDRNIGALSVDTAISFQVVVRRADDSGIAGQIALELVPVGKGEISLSARNWSLTGSETALPSLDVTLRNTGSQPLRDIRWVVEGPSKWQLSVSPEHIQLLDPSEEVQAKIVVGDSSIIETGLFEIEVRAQSFSEHGWIESDTKTLRMNIESGNKTFTTVVIVSLVLIVIVGIVVGTIRISRR